LCLDEHLLESLQRLEGTAVRSVGDDGHAKDSGGEISPACIHDSDMFMTMAVQRQSEAVEQALQRDRRFAQLAERKNRSRSIERPGGPYENLWLFEQDILWCCRA
jgi:hypothetical protein